MDTQPQPLDIERFAKLWNFAESVPHGADNTNEREIARRMAEATAAKAGLSLDEAVAHLGASDKPVGAGRTHEKRKRQAQPAPRSAMEDKLYAALDAAGVGEVTYMLGLSWPAWQCVRFTIPWPKNLREVVAEIRAWDRLEAARNRSATGYYFLKGAGSVRREMLFSELATMRAASVADAQARADWLAESVSNITIIIDVDQIARAVADDMRRMTERLTTLTRNARRDAERAVAGQIRRRSNLDKRQAVEAVLRAPGGDRLTLRQVAERAGVSAETVRTVKRALS